MSGKLIAGGLIGLGCIAAAAGGGYWALRSNAADLRPAVSAAPAAPVAPDTPVAAAPETPAPAAPAAAAIPSTRNAGASRSREAATPKPEPERVVAEDAPPTAVVTTPDPATTNTQTMAASTAAPAATTGSAAPSGAPAPLAPPVPSAPPAPPAPPAKYDEVTVASDSVIGLRLDSTISSETARVEDRVNARLSRDVMVGGRVAIASGSRLEGVVTQVERGGKFKERPRLGIAFNTLVLADGTRVSIQTDTIFRDGDSPAGQANAKVGGSAVIGAIVGAMIGGRKGALFGGTAGAAGGAAAVAAGDRAEAVMTSGTQLTVRLTSPITVLIERTYGWEDRRS